MFLDIPQLCGKQLGLLKEIVPGLSRLAVFGIPGLNAAQFAATESAACRSRYPVVIPLMFQSSKLIAELALAKRLPLISLFADFPRNGGLMAYGPNLEDMYRRCGAYVGKVLHGAKPSELPLQRPERFDLIINVKTAKEIGLVVPRPRRRRYRMRHAMSAIGLSPQVKASIDGRLISDC
jgi:putative ABC transport system substrate-binding protein